MILTMVRLFLLLLLFLCNVVVVSTQLQWLCLGNEIGSCYLKRLNQRAVTFQTASAFCQNQDATLAMFPAIEEMELIYQLITIETKYNINQEQTYAPTYYWIGLRYDDNHLSNVTNHSLHWINSKNNIIVSADKWTPQRRFNLSNPAKSGAGCVTAEIYIEHRHIVKTRLTKMSSCSHNGVKNFMCEKTDPDDPNPGRWFQQWEAWKPTSCQSPGATFVSRKRLCFSHECELRGMTVVNQTRACCNAPPRSIPHGNVIKEYRHPDPSIQLVRALENTTAQLRCHTGYVHPITRLTAHRIKCILNSRNEGHWDSELPVACVIANCGEPPLGVHTYPPLYKNTTYNEILTYFCQPGFKEPKRKQSSVTLRCSVTEKWIGLDFDENTKASCEPITNIALEWSYYQNTDHCYQLHHRAVSWQQAKNDCAGGLLYLLSPEELNFLKVNIFEPQAERSIIWTSGYKNASEDKFRWTLENTTSLPLDGYTNWYDGWNPVSGVHHTNMCIAANYSGGQWKWINATCNNNFEYVCKTQQEKKHGGWSKWTEWSACDRNFVRRRKHICNDPAPFCGGDDCVGPAQEQSNCCVDPGRARYTNLVYRSIDNATVFLLPGHYYTYNCYYGYEHTDGTDSKNITCLDNGTWTDPGVAPACVPKLCSDPENGTHSIITAGSSDVYGHGARISYDCERGYGTTKTANPNIGSQTNCSNGQWVDPPLQCYARLCATPHPTPSSRSAADRKLNLSSVVRHINNESHTSWGGGSQNKDLYQDVYQYFCEFGYRTSYKTADYNITCTSNGDWRKEASFANDHHPTLCEPVECPGPPPQPKPNSRWESGVSPSNPSSFRGNYKQSAFYKCIPGYQVDTGIEGDERIILNYTFTCGANNDWTDDFSPEQCVKQYCGDPGNGTNVQSRIGKSFWYNDTLDYICKQGYTFNHSVIRRHLICGLHGGSQYVSWNGTQLMCDKVYCGDPGNGSNVIRTGKNLEYGGIIIYKCIKQHVLIGGGLEVLWLRCGSSGNWNGTAPSCEPAEMTSDFEVLYVKPYTVQAQWIMSEKYKGLPVQHLLNYTGRPGYETALRGDDYPYSFPEYAIVNKTMKLQSSVGGLIKVLIYTKPDYNYDFTLESSSQVSNQDWPEDKTPPQVFTSGGMPFMGSVQKQNLPAVIPLSALLEVQRKPQALKLESESMLLAKFNRKMFSEENSTILGFAVVVKEVHPFHSSEEIITKEGYHDRYPNELYTYNGLQSFTKYEIWPAYFASSLCNPFAANSTCQDVIGERPSELVTFIEQSRDNSSNLAEYKWINSIYSNISLNGDSVSFLVGSDTRCEEYSDNLVCNGPLRKNRRFCVKLRAYSRYGWNDSQCSNIIELAKVLEFDRALIVPTILSSLPFVVFLSIGMYLKFKRAGENSDKEDADGEIVNIWSRQISNMLPDRLSRPSLAVSNANVGNVKLRIKRSGMEEYSPNIFQDSPSLGQELPGKVRGSTPSAELLKSHEFWNPLDRLSND